MREKELDQAKLKSEFESQIDQQIAWPKELKPLIKQKYVFNLSDRARWEAQAAEKDSLFSRPILFK